jgi:hypothetical protein
MKRPCPFSANVRRLASSLATLAVVAGPYAGPANAATRSHHRPPPTATAGMVVSIDPESRSLAMPTPDQSARLAAMARRVGVTKASGRPAPVRHPDGRISLDVRGWMRDFTVARIGPDGRLVTSCVTGNDEAARLVHEPVRVPATPEER